MAITVDANFPAGNIVVERIEGNEVFLHQDLRDTEGWWFYWCFRVRGAAGRTLAFHFTNKDVFAARGPAVSVDGGKTWAWLGRRRVRAQSFRYTFVEDADEVLFSFAMPYTQSNLREFLARHANSVSLKADTMCKTGKGRRVERLRFGRLDGGCEHRVLLTCRHHACEMMANYALEGVIESVLADTDVGEWFREHVEFLVIPFVDKDGVEDGDQGKNRRPRDHNRDYEGKSIYASTRAVREFVPQWSEGKLRFSIDMHCPWVRGNYSEVIYFVGEDDEHNWAQLRRFSRILASVRTGPLPYSSRNNLPFGKAWNTVKNYKEGKSCSRWVGELPRIVLATSVELPYATASRQPVTAESARAFGRDLAKAIRRFLHQKDSDTACQRPRK